MKIGTIEGGASGTIRVKSSTDIVDSSASGGVNFRGKDILIEAGDGEIGEAGHDITVDIFSGGGLTARADGDVRITAPTTDLLIRQFFSAFGHGLSVDPDGLDPRCHDFGFRKDPCRQRRLQLGRFYRHQGQSARDLCHGPV